ncbi:MAG: CaiB/BaiF CoA-transferase family protein [Ilumatobacteraceae bacterium]
MEPNTLPSPFEGLRVIELADDSAGELTGKLLQQWGAGVVKVEPPGGGPSRHVGPFAGGVRDVERSLEYWYYNGGKESVVVDLDTAMGHEALRGLVKGADILITTRQSVGEAGRADDWASMHDEGLIVVSVTPFGRTGPWADFVSSDLVALALGGPLNSCGYDDHTIPPIRPGGQQAYHTASSFAFIGLLVALIERERTGRGQLIDISMHEALAVTVERANLYWFYQQLLVQRQTCRHAVPTPSQPALFACVDDRFVYFAFVIAEQKPWRTVVEWLATKEMVLDLDQPEYDDPEYRQAHFAHIQNIIECFFLLDTAENLYREGQERGLPIGILNAPEDVLVDHHLAARKFFETVDDDIYGSYSVPGPPFRFSAAAPTRSRRPPRLGEHGLIPQHT